MFKPRPYQNTIANKGVDILKKYKIFILLAEMRVGKTFISLMVADRCNFQNVLFLTRKKAINSIESDYETMNPGFDITVINFESLHRIENKGFDLVIIDEFHNLSAFPKPSKRTKKAKEYVGDLPVIFLSGTPSPESFSQLFHPLWVTKHSPWNQYRNFYAWARDYVNVYERWIAGNPRKFYDKAIKQKVFADIEHLVISFTQEEAGFTSLVEEEVITLPIPSKLKELYDEMDSDEVIITSSWAVAASNAADRINKLAQICGGTLKVDDDKTVELSQFKAEYIRDHFDQNKIAIFYKYQAEKLILEDVFPDSTDVPEEFNESDVRYFIGQIQSVREGVNLKAADCIVMYNIDFSATSYYQARARLQSKERQDPAKVYWLFCQDGIEQYVYKAVQKKKSFTSSYYNKIKKHERIMEAN